MTNLLFMRLFFQSSLVSGKYRCRVIENASWIYSVNE